MKRAFHFFLLLGMASSADAAFSRRKPIVIDNTRVMGASDLTDFPVLVSLVDANLQAAVTSPLGYDIAFRAEDDATCGAAGPLLELRRGQGLSTRAVAIEDIYAELGYGATLNCLNGYFHFPYFDSLAEALVKAEGKGAIAAFSPSGLSLDAPAHRFHEALLRALLRAGHRRLGDAVLAAQEEYASSGAFPELLSIYHLLGDPALKLRN